MAKAKQRKRLGEMLVEAGLVTKEQINKALEYSRKHGVRLGKALVRMNIVEEEDIIKTISEQLNIPYVDVGNILFDPEIVVLIPEAFARKNKVIPLFLVDDTLTVAISDPLNVYIIDDLANIVGKKINVVISTESDIETALKNFYANEGTISEAFAIEGLESRETGANEKPVIKLVNNILISAVKEEASDIHLEPGKTKLRVRFRVDGVLHTHKIKIPTYLNAAIISRIKIMGDLDIAEKRSPQDGRFPLDISGKKLDVRVSTLPTIFGEKIVLRLLDKSNILVGLDSLGIDETDFEIVLDALKTVNGILLVTGPTGSGKTTTLYAALQMLNSEDKNIITVEDPVEYQLKHVNQVQVNPQAGITFASGLRSILRQDPDIIMVGEIRDAETAEIAVQAALTGHLVLSTLHTNNAVSTISRLIDMKVEPFLLASSIRAIIAQRLVRKLCPHCIEAYPAAEAERAVLGDQTSGEITLYHGKGCNFCNKTGYKGRTGLYEILRPDRKIRNLVMNRRPMDELEDAALASGFTPMRKQGIRKVLKGITSLEEVLRVTRD
ncbi:MAG: type II secretion system protein GspE [Acidobacteria bacterium]|nr:MAG: type II secretion system protein GspE [Acidobacteriota bacterium]RLE21094.1 MAG: type II secretion system protein GspE [Acidobacteriota bacterium]